MKYWLPILAAGVVSIPMGDRAASAGQSPSSQSAPASDADGTAISNDTLPRGARLFIAPMANGFDTYVIAGLQKKNVPVTVVGIREKADYELTGVSETDKAGWAKMLFMGSDNTRETASIKIVNVKTGTVVYAYSVNKGSAARGKQSAGESVAKHIKEKIEGR